MGENWKRPRVIQMEIFRKYLLSIDSKKKKLHQTIIFFYFNNLIYVNSNKYIYIDTMF